MNKNIFKIAALLGLSALTFGTVACDDDNDSKETPKVSVAVKAGAAADTIEISKEMLKGLQVVFTDTRNMDTLRTQLTELGDGSIDIPVGVYNVFVEQVVKNSAGKDTLVYFRDENVSLKEGSTVNIKLAMGPSGSSYSNFIFSEVFFNGERMMHPDQYFVVYNPTDEILYADGLAFATTKHLTWQDKAMWYDEYYNAGKVPVNGLAVIPGSGKDHPVKPGDKLVIAFTAIDHTASNWMTVDTTFNDKKEVVKIDTTFYPYDHAVDLTGADFEIYQPNVKSLNDVDNPDVPNLVEVYNGESNYFSMHPRGYRNILMVKLENGEQSTIDSYFKKNSSVAKEKSTNSQTKEVTVVDVQIFSVDTKDILDGVATSDIPSDIVTRVLPTSVDRGKVLVKGCHSSLLAIRHKVSGSRENYVDTNDSSNDFYLQTPQNAYPKGWRNN